VPQGGKIENGQVTGYPQPTDDDPARPEKNHADGRHTSQNNAAPFAASQLSTPEYSFILKSRLLSLPTENLQVK
jgi:hypothetical protein